MSDSTNVPRALHAVPPAEPLTELTGTPATIHTALIDAPGATAAELALAAGLGRSTAGKALATLEEHGLAVREEGGRTGARRTPDRWRVTHATNSTAPPCNTETSANLSTTEELRDYPSAVEPTHTDETTAQFDIASASPVPNPSNSSASSDSENPACGSPAPTDTTEAEPEVHTVPAREAEVTAVPIAAGKAAALTSVTDGSFPMGAKTRLAPGALRHMVIGYLTAHPEEAFTATRIGRTLERSSGAVANCLATLAKQGGAEVVTDRPRTYRLAPPTTTAAE
ncbi:helix-turn-helix domain-containing protein [Streptomyces sp. BH055]|uniref:helix-turn-helix domain-containing protein n=1 Tax=Streptomyces sp. BH055 TaxID=3401173 RepID=UPI003BB77637